MNIDSIKTAFVNALVGLLPVSLGSKTSAASLAVVVASDQAAVPVGGTTATTSVTRTRPADTTAYTALDTVADSTSAATVITFTNMARANGGSGYITKALLKTDQSTNVASFRLHLYNAAPGTLINDNAAFTDLWVDNAAYIGYIDFDPCSTETASSTAAKSLNNSIRLAFVCGGSTTSLFGVLQTRTAFTPASAQNFLIKLTAEQN